MESQENYFGKSGMSLHIDVFVMKTNGNWTNSFYITIFDKADQDTIDVFIKSDNAGCYQNSSMVEAVKTILEKHDLKLQRYDFCESQKGKDLCDLEAVFIKSKIKKGLDRNPHLTIRNTKELNKTNMSE